MTDFANIQPRHDQINVRLEQWARWVKVRSPRWEIQPMFRHYRAPRQYAYETQDIPVPINAIDALEIERGVSFLPAKHRDVLRWYYVFHWIHPGIMQRRLALTEGGLSKLLDDSRDMLKNRIKTKLVEGVDRRMEV